MAPSSLCLAACLLAPLPALEFATLAGTWRGDPVASEAAMRNRFAPAKSEANPIVEPAGIPLSGLVAMGRQRAEAHFTFQAGALSVVGFAPDSEPKAVVITHFASTGPTTAVMQTQHQHAPNASEQQLEIRPDGTLLISTDFWTIVLRRP